MTYIRKCQCWTLSIEDIEEAAKIAGVPSEELSADDCLEIAAKFKNSIACALDDWLEILIDAVQMVWEEKAAREKTAK